MKTEEEEEKSPYVIIGILFKRLSFSVVILLPSLPLLSYGHWRVSRPPCDLTYKFLELSRL